jgi:hypothetical protein
MNDYIDAVCEGVPLEAPKYDNDSDTWSVWFEESDTSWHPYFDRDLIEVHFDSQTEAESAYNHYSQPNES